MLKRQSALLFILRMNVIIRSRQTQRRTLAAPNCLIMRAWTSFDQNPLEAIPKSGTGGHENPVGNAGGQVGASNLTVPAVLGGLGIFHGIFGDGLAVVASWVRLCRWLRDVSKRDPY